MLDKSFIFFWAEGYSFNWWAICFIIIIWISAFSKSLLSFYFPLQEEHSFETISCHVGRLLTRVAINIWAWRSLALEKFFSK